MSDSINFPEGFIPQLKNNIIHPKPGDEILFHVNATNVYASLDGYAIIPVEEYKKLKTTIGDSHEG